MQRQKKVIQITFYGSALKNEADSVERIAVLFDFFQSFIVCMLANFLLQGEANICPNQSDKSFPPLSFSVKMRAAEEVSRST